LSSGRVAEHSLYQPVDSESATLPFNERVAPQHPNGAVKRELVAQTGG
jgi:hypothetical protein